MVGDTGETGGRQAEPPPPLQLRAHDVTWWECICHYITASRWSVGHLSILLQNNHLYASTRFSVHLSLPFSLNLEYLFKTYGPAFDVTASERRKREKKKDPSLAPIESSGSVVKLFLK